MWLMGAVVTLLTQSLHGLVIKSSLWANVTVTGLRSNSLISNIDNIHLGCCIHNVNKQQFFFSNSTVKVLWLLLPD